MAHSFGVTQRVSGDDTLIVAAQSRSISGYSTF
jgi:hypothetical protein